jgi:hypothetical protein
MRKAFDWERSRISMLEVEAVPQSCIPLVQIGLSIILYMRSLLLVESLDLTAKLVRGFNISFKFLIT